MLSKLKNHRKKKPLINSLADIERPSRPIRQDDMTRDERIEVQIYRGLSRHAIGNGGRRATIAAAMRRLRFPT